MKYFLGVDIGGTKIAYGLFDQEKNLLAKKIHKSDDTCSSNAYFSRVADSMQELVDDANIDMNDVKGIGIGVAGFVDFLHGRLIVAASLPKLHNFPVVQFIREKLRFSGEIILDNDCHCGALAEFRRGAGRGHQNMLYCPISTGISSGIIIDGKLFRGSNGASGESGHMLTAVEGELKVACGCGNAGCFNSLCSGKAITEHICSWINCGEETLMTQLAGSPEAISAVHINQAFEMDDPMAQKALNQMADYFAMWLYNVYMLLNIDCIVFSGGLLQMGEKLFSRIETRFQQYHNNRFPVHFHKTELGADSGLIGALELLF